MPFASLSEAHAGITITCAAPSKTFNIPGLSTAYTLISNVAIRKSFAERIKTLAIGSLNYFGPSATIAAYTQSEDWLDAVLDYIRANRDFAIAYLATHLPAAAPILSEGTYLLWVDCRALGWDKAQIKQMMYKEAKIAFTEGSVYGQNGEGFLRINLACPRSLLQEALERFCTAAAARNA
ncbi:Cystathionine beta-lyase PatB [compost metagenome]